MTIKIAKRSFKTNAQTYDNLLHFFIANLERLIPR